MTPQVQDPTSGRFSDRVEFLLAGRSITPWARWLRISAGTRSRMTTGGGVPPTYEALTRIMRAENVSLSWFVDGMGPPFHVVRTLDDVRTAAELRNELEDPGWRIGVLGLGEQGVIVLHQPAAIGTGDEQIDYTAVVVIAGPGHSHTVNAVFEQPGRVSHVQDIDLATRREIEHGLWGTWRLLGDAETPGLLAAEHEAPELDASYLQLQRELAAYATGVAEERAPALAPDLAGAWPNLTDAERSAITVLLGPLLEVAQQRAARTGGW